MVSAHFEHDRFANGGRGLSGLGGAANGPRGARGASRPVPGPVHGAGGIGGLLAAYETQGTSQTTDDKSYWFLYDGNGNVGQVLDATDHDPPGDITVAARYEYDPYGNIIGPDDNSNGDWKDDATAYALANPFRFSTKWFDTELASSSVNGAVGESGLGYWGYRYYSPRLGRWLNRDPIEEEGGLNLYGFLRNRPIDRIDRLGRLFGGPPYYCPPPPPKNCSCCRCGEGEEARHQLGVSAALKCKTIADSAIDAAKAFGSNMLQRKAFQHCYGQCVATRELGPRTARICGDIHEYCGKQMPGHEAGDQHNNRIGRLLGLRASSNSDCYTQCYDLTVDAGSCTQGRQPPDLPAGKLDTCFYPGIKANPNPSFRGCGRGPGGGAPGVPGAPPPPRWK